MKKWQFLIIILVLILGIGLGYVSKPTKQIEKLVDVSINEDLEKCKNGKGDFKIEYDKWNHPGQIYVECKLPEQYLFDYAIPINQ